MPKFRVTSVFSHDVEADSDLDAIRYAEDREGWETEAIPLPVKPSAPVIIECEGGIVQAVHGVGEYLLLDWDDVDDDWPTASDRLQVLSAYRETIDPQLYERLVLAIETRWPEETTAWKEANAG